MTRGRCSANVLAGARTLDQTQKPSDQETSGAGKHVSCLKTKENWKSLILSQASKFLYRKEMKH